MKVFECKKNFCLALAAVFAFAGLQAQSLASFRAVDSAYRRYFSSSGEERIEALRGYCQSLSPCVQGESQQMQSIRVSESLFFLSEVVGSDDYGKLRQVSPGVAAETERDCVSALKRYFAKRNGSDIFASSRMADEKRAEIESMLSISEGLLFPVPYAFPFSILPQSGESSRNVVFYRGISEASDFFSIYDPRKIKSLLDCPPAVFALEKTDISFRESVRAFEDMESFAGKASKSESLIPPSLCKFFSLQMSESLFARLNEDASVFYQFWVYSHWLQSLSERFGISFSVFFSQEFADELEALLADDVLFMEVFFDVAGAKEALPAMKSICESASWIAPRYFAAEYGVFPDD